MMKEDYEKIEIFTLESARLSVGLIPREIIEEAGAGNIQLYFRVPGKFEVWGVEWSGNQVVNSEPLPVQFVALSPVDCTSIIAIESYRQAKFKSGLHTDKNGNLQTTFLPLHFTMKSFEDSKSLARRVAYVNCYLNKSQYEFVVCPAGLERFNFDQLIEIPVLASDIVILKQDLEKLALLQSMDQPALEEIDSIQFPENASKKLRLLKITINHFWREQKYNEADNYPDKDEIKRYLSGNDESLTPAKMHVADLEPLQDYMLSMAATICTPEFADRSIPADIRKNITEIYNNKFKHLIQVFNKTWKDIDLNDKKKIPLDQSIIDEFILLGYKEGYGKLAGILIRPDAAPRSEMNRPEKKKDKTTKVKHIH